MARRLKIADLEARKRALVAESEVYRQSLKLELTNLRLYGATLRRKWSVFSSLKPVFIVGLPLLSALVSKRRRKKMGWIRTLFGGWRLFRTVSPVLQFALSARRGAPVRVSAAPTPEPQQRV